MRYLVGLASFAGYVATRLAAGAVGGTVLGVVLHHRNQRRLPVRTDFLQHPTR